MTLADLQRLTNDIRDPDLRQDTIVSLLEQQPQTEADAETVIRRVRYRCENHRRKTPKQLYVESLSTDTDDSDERIARFKEAAQTLPEADRELYDLLVFGHTQAEAALQMGITRQTVIQRHKRLIHLLSK